MDYLEDGSVEKLNRAKANGLKRFFYIIKNIKIIKEFEEEKKVSDNRFNNLIKEIREIKDWINIHSNPDYNPTLCQETGSSSSGPGVESYSKTSGSNPTEPRPDIPKRDQFLLTNHTQNKSRNYYICSRSSYLYLPLKK